MSSPQKSPRSRSNLSEEKREELRRVNRERARQRRALMTEEEKQQIRGRQRLNAQKKRNEKKERQKEKKEGGYSQGRGQAKTSPSAAMSNHASSSSSTPLHSPLTIPHPQGYSIPQAHHQIPQSHSMGMHGQWGMNNLSAMGSPSQLQIPSVYQHHRPGPIHSDPNIISPNQQQYGQQQRYDPNDFNDRAQMQGQLKMTMGVIDDCVRRLGLLEKDVLTWKTKFEIETARREGIEQWVMEKFGVDLAMKALKAQTPVKRKAAKPRARKKKKVEEPVEERFPVNNESIAKIPAPLPMTSSAAVENNMWPFDADAVQAALNLDGLAYHALNTANSIPPFNVSKNEPVDLYSSTINPNSSIVSYK